MGLCRVNRDGDIKWILVAICVPSMRLLYYVEDTEKADMTLKVIWLTGLPCSGKTTLAHQIQLRLGGHILDGDEVRKGLCNDLDFSKEDRIENIRRVGEVAKLINGLVIVALVSPYKKSRDAIRNKFKVGDNVKIIESKPYSKKKRWEVINK